MRWWGSGDGGGRRRIDLGVVCEFYPFLRSEDHSLSLLPTSLSDGTIVMPTVAPGDRGRSSPCSLVSEVGVVLLSNSVTAREGSSEVRLEEWLEVSWSERECLRCFFFFLWCLCSSGGCDSGEAVSVVRV